MLGRIDGDGLEGGEGVHTGLDGEPCAEGEVLFRDDGVVGDDADLEAGLGEDAGGLEGLVDQLDLADMVVRDPVAMKCAFGENPKRCYREKGDSARMTTAAKLRDMPSPGAGWRPWPMAAILPSWMEMSAS